MSQKSITLLLYIFLGFIVVFTVVILLLLAPQFIEKGPTPFPSFSPTIPSHFMDRSFITGQPCQAPCWYNLEVEKSTHEEVLRVIDTLSFLDSDHITKTNTGYFDAIDGENLSAYLLNVVCMSRRHRSCVTLIFVDDILKEIIISPNYPISFEEAVEILGPPEYIRASPGDRSNIDSCDIFLLWSEKLIEVIARNVGVDNPEHCSVVFNGIGVHPYLDVDAINYIAPDNWAAVNFSGADTWNGFVDQ